MGSHWRGQAGSLCVGLIVGLVFGAIFALAVAWFMHSGPGAGSGI